MNKALRIQKSEAARNKRQHRRKINETKLLNEYARLRKLDKESNLQAASRHCNYLYCMDSFK